MDEETSGNQRVRNAQIFSKLETMDKRLKSVEETGRITADHAIRCGAKWDQYDKDQRRVSDRLGKLENNKNGDERKQMAINGGLIAAVVLLIEVVKMLVL